MRTPFTIVLLILIALAALVVGSDMQVSATFGTLPLVHTARSVLQNIFGDVIFGGIVVIGVSAATIIVMFASQRSGLYSLADLQQALATHVTQLTGQLEKANAENARLRGQLDKHAQEPMPTTNDVDKRLAYLTTEFGKLSAVIAQIVAAGSEGPQWHVVAGEIRDMLNSLGMQVAKLRADAAFKEELDGIAGQLKLILDQPPRLRATG